MIQPLIKDKLFQGILISAGRRETMPDRTSISQEITDIGRHLHCLGSPTLPRTTAMGDSDMGRFTFGATAIMDDY